MALFAYWEVRENGKRIAHCGTLESASRLASMGESGLRTVHKVNSLRLEQETVDVEVTNIEVEKQQCLPFDTRKPLRL